jgi:hypothetical protein
LPAPSIPSMTIKIPFLRRILRPRGKQGTGKESYRGLFLLATFFGQCVFNIG